jgi:hypothetical protein
VLLALGVNIGIAVYPEQAIDVASLVQRAHIAADTAQRHRSGWELYDPVHDPATPRRLALAADLREALESDGLDVCFQPKVELAPASCGREAWYAGTTCASAGGPTSSSPSPSTGDIIADHGGDAEGAGQCRVAGRASTSRWRSTCRPAASGPAWWTTSPSWKAACPQSLTPG